MLPVLFAGPAQAGSVCEDRVRADLAAQQMTVPDLAVMQACDSFQQQRTAAGVADLDAFSLIGASSAVETTETFRNASCLLYGQITSQNTAIYVVVGVAATAGVASFTRIICSASPSGEGFNVLTPGSVSAGADLTTEGLPPSDPLARQTVCTYGNWAWIVGSGGATSKCV